MCFNLWQVCNEALNANRKSLQYANERNDLLTTADGILGINRSKTVDRKFKGIFDLSYATLTAYTNERLRRWTTMAQFTINYDPVLAGG